MTLQLEFLDRMAAIEAAEWDRVVGSDYPFTRHCFLQALESSGSVSRRSGWQPHHLLVRDAGQLVGVMPLYLKYHSYGEYVFDWAWAEAYQRHGLDYYPKLLAAIPFTPATGPRLCLLPEYPADRIMPELVALLSEHGRQQQASSLHLLFPPRSQADALQASGLVERCGVQYHWFNEGYRDFADFLDHFSSRKRKNLRKERETVERQGLTLETLTGPAATAARMEQFYTFYQMTYAKRSGHGGYLTRDFFQQIAATMPEQIVLVMASAGSHPVAGALYFRDSQTLYGRYWGCVREYDALHFEACYYRGIDFCLNERLQRFDPGAQGEHKIQRGFTPVLTYSYHRLFNSDFQRAIADFVQRERQALTEYLPEAQRLLPFKRG